MDTTAAGDTFTGYFLASYIREKSGKEALRRGTLAAALAVERPGAAVSIRERREGPEKWRKQNGRRPEGRESGILRRHKPYISQQLLLGLQAPGRPEPLRKIRFPLPGHKPHTRCPLLWEQWYSQFRRSRKRRWVAPSISKVNTGRSPVSLSRGSERNSPVFRVRVTVAS